MKRLILVTLVAALALLAVPSLASADIYSPYRFCGYSSNHLGVLGGPGTSCGFAKATVEKWLNTPGRHGPYYRVYSPVTHRTYTMHARWIRTQDSPYMLFTGGNGARVKLVS
jgi:hypothetical protein